MLTESDVNMIESNVAKGRCYTSNGTETFISPHAQIQTQQTPQQPLPFVPLDNSAAHIAQYDSKQGGYVPGTGSVANNECTQGNFNNQGMTGPGVNGTVQSTGSVAYGGAYNSQYEGDYYSAKRVNVGAGTGTGLPLSSAPLDVKVVSSTEASGEFDYAAVRGQYGDGYSTKR